MGYGDHPGLVLDLTGGISGATSTPTFVGSFVGIIE
jgi:hypothetical protein